MSSAARERALSNSGEEIFDRMYETYARFHGNDGVRHESLDVAKVESGNGLCLLRLVVWRFRERFPALLAISSYHFWNAGPGAKDAASGMVTSCGGNDGDQFCADA